MTKYDTNDKMWNFYIVVINNLIQDCSYCLTILNTSSCFIIHWNESTSWLWLSSGFEMLKQQNAGWTYFQLVYKGISM